MPVARQTQAINTKLLIMRQCMQCLCVCATHYKKKGRPPFATLQCHSRIRRKGNQVPASKVTQERKERPEFCKETCWQRALKAVQTPYSIPYVLYKSRAHWQPPAYLIYSQALLLNRDLPKLVCKPYWEKSRQSHPQSAICRMLTSKLELPVQWAQDLVATFLQAYASRHNTPR